ncbi:hypothetical protein CVV38_04420 [Candidatus Peregrinibacteria bacterium HGW-Peregrinibacteria-1]|jgi:rare lipoprotein A (peptidoglycan hydrolase)|nr:MAG: hypothetical protein CVV38_04420 [Candidatus Peregrinibacteria bacterium HGW-Peregrinibacteria-1]
MILQNLAKKVSVSLLALTFPLTAITAIGFSDVTLGTKNYVAIEFLKEKGIISGYEDGTFKPRQLVSRAEAIKMLLIGTGQYTDQSIEEKAQEIETLLFTDVNNNEWYIPYLKTAILKDIVSGYDDNTFKPEQTVNLAESLKIFLEAFDDLQYPEEQELIAAIEHNKISDIDLESWYAKYVKYAAAKDLLEIFNDYNVNPDQEMTRGHIAEIIYRHMLAQEGYRFGKATFYGKAVQGNFTASGERFDMNTHTAAHRTLPFGTVVKVTNLANNKSVDVKINDRGPYGPGRVIDLSSSAFAEIASLGAGVIHVNYQVISE